MPVYAMKARAGPGRARSGGNIRGDLIARDRSPIELISERERETGTVLLFIMNADSSARPSKAMSFHAY